MAIVKFIPSTFFSGRTLSPKMPSTSLVTELSSRIAANTAKIEEYLSNHSLPIPLFAVNAPLNLEIPTKESDILAARQAAIDDTLELHQLMLGPREHLLSYRPADLVSKLAVIRFGFARLVLVDGEATFAELAAAAGLDEAHMRRTGSVLPAAGRKQINTGRFFSSTILRELERPGQTVRACLVVIDGGEKQGGKMTEKGIN